jgi:histidyl-tRNA synthetase
MKAQMKLANRSDAQFAVIIGEQEQADGTVIVKPMHGGEQVTIPRSELIAQLSETTNS